MTQEVQHIPPSRRHVRWVVALSARWPIGLIGLVMTIYGALIALMLFHADHGTAGDDDLLDRGPTARADGRVTEVVPYQGSWLSSQPSERVSYSFVAPGGQHTGFSFVPMDRFRVDDPISVVYLPGQMETNRADGGRLCLLGDYISPVIGFVVLPGLLLVLLWIQGAHTLRCTLAEGDVAAAQISSVERVAWVIPVMLRARYRFRDRSARWRDGHHWVLARSPIGVRLAAGDDEMSVIHDRDRPEFSRLVVPGDFVTSPSEDEQLPQPSRS